MAVDDHSNCMRRASYASSSAASCALAADLFTFTFTFLRSLMRPGGRPIKRNQNLVVNCLNEKGTALVFYTGAAGRARRDALVVAGSHRHPHGEIRYHMELMALLGEAVMGQSAATERQVQEMLPIDELLQLLL
jgi:hypothetical protein